MGEYITLGDSLIITVFSMLVVFVALILISYLIRILRVVATEKKDVAENKIENTFSSATVLNSVEEEKINETDEEELVAVIAAAIAASLDVSIPQVKIKSIRRVPQNTPLWAEVGRREQIKGI